MRFLPLLFLPLSAFAEKPNILLLCVDDLRPDIHALGAEHIHSPAMDSLVLSGRAFTRHYVQAPTCGASRYSLLTGRYATTTHQKNNDAFFCPQARKADAPPSMPKHFRSHGYQTVAIGKISHHPGGLGGKDWMDPAKVEMPDAWDINLMPTPTWKTPQGAMHGYAGGVPRGKYRPVREHKAGEDTTYTDGWIAEEAMRRMNDLAAGGKPYFLAIGIMKPHLPFACPQKYLDLYQGKTFPPIAHPQKPQSPSTWHASGEFCGYHHEVSDPRGDVAYGLEMRKSYAACISYADAQIGKILQQLEHLDQARNTIVILWGDHGWHLGEHAIWGKHSLFEESLHAPLIIRAPGLKQPGQATATIAESIDLFPTLCELTALPIPSGLDGGSLRASLDEPSTREDRAISYQERRETIRSSRYRLIRHRSKDEPVFELYDHTTPQGETRNIAADHPEVVATLAAEMDRRLTLPDGK